MSLLSINLTGDFSLFGLGVANGFFLIELSLFFRADYNILILLSFFSAITCVFEKLGLLFGKVFMRLPLSLFYGLLGV
jgi:hypothetical protein